VLTVTVLLVAALAALVPALLERAGRLRLAAPAAPPHLVFTTPYIPRRRGGRRSAVRAAGELRVEHFPDDRVETVADELLDLRATLLDELSYTPVQVDAHRVECKRAGRLSERPGA
jgi:hypothetical protein